MKKRRVLMRRKKIRVSVTRHLFLLVTLIMFSIAMMQNSSSINVYEAKRGVSMRVTSNNNAFIGIMHENLYHVMFHEDNNTITISIKNNLPCTADYELALSGIPIDEFNPSSFRLSPNGSQNIDIKIKGIEGKSEIQGNIVAKFIDGSINTNFKFQVMVKLQPKETEMPTAVQGEIGPDSSNLLKLNKNSTLSTVDKVVIENNNNINKNEKNAELSTKALGSQK